MRTLFERPPAGWIGGRLGPSDGIATPPTTGGPMVVKLGGSLLTVADWPVPVRRLLAQLGESGRIPTLVVGGGAVADGLRRLDAAAAPPAALAHALAIGCMTITARLAARALGLPLLAEPSSSVPAVLDAEAWLASRQGGGLPESWRVTSDSIAAAVAHSEAGGRTLLLLKRVPPDDTASRRQKTRPPATEGDQLSGLAASGLAASGLAAGGWVDAHFPVISAGLWVEWLAPARHSLPGPA